MTSGKINDFVSTFKNGFLHSNLFNVTFTENKIVQDNNILSYACKSAQIPGITFNEGKYFVNGYYRKFVSGADYDPITFVFLVDGKSEIIKILDKWGSAIYKDGKYGFKDDYKCGINIELLNRDGTVSYTSKIIDAYPTNLASFDLSWDNTDQLLDYAVTFNYLTIETK